VTKWRDGGVANRGYFLTARDHSCFGRKPRSTWSSNGTSYTDFVGPTIIPFNERHHFAAVRDGTAMLLYVDGVLAQPS
jgi:hypothetical protein